MSRASLARTKKRKKKELRNRYLFLADHAAVPYNPAPMLLDSFPSLPWKKQKQKRPENEIQGALNKRGVVGGWIRIYTRIRVTRGSERRIDNIVIEERGDRRESTTLVRGWEGRSVILSKKRGQERKEGPRHVRRAYLLATSLGGILMPLPASTHKVCRRRCVCKITKYI